MCARTLGKPDFPRLRVRFGKDGRLAYLGHLEVINTVMRSVRRSGLPFSVGNGFAQRMRIQFSQALPVGAASRDEYYDLYLTERCDEREAFEALRAASPAAMAPLEAAYMTPRLPALEAWLTRSAWEAHLVGAGDDFCADALDTALKDLQGQGVIHFMRGDKPRSIELATTLVSWRAEDAGVEGPWRKIDLRLDTRSSNLGALRPAVLIEAAMGTAALADSTLDALRVLRTGQWHEDEGGALVQALAPEFRLH